MDLLTSAGKCQAATLSGGRAEADKGPEHATFGFSIGFLNYSAAVSFAVL